MLTPQAGNAPLCIVLNGLDRRRGCPDGRPRLMARVPASGCACDALSVSPIFWHRLLRRRAPDRYG
jgi:hypothetical protein